MPGMAQHVVRWAGAGKASDQNVGVVFRGCSGCLCVAAPNTEVAFEQHARQCQVPKTHTHTHTHTRARARTQTIYTQFTHTHNIYTTRTYIYTPTHTPNVRHAIHNCHRSGDSVIWFVRCGVILWLLAFVCPLSVHSNDG